MYNFNCTQCPSVYNLLESIDETKCVLKKRKYEQKNAKEPENVINIHRNSTRHDFDWEKPNILVFESN